ncbi:R3H domain [Dillenia turbinata]|uniref:R3H domain n=1 Tax=Dillenia turbinata TaxID=194707 RepID=A0AAN8UV50_9MAGN
MTRSGKKRQKNGEAPKPRVTESSRIRISQILEDFRASDAEVYTFEANLTNNERAVVHEVCRKMGMHSKSSGFLYTGMMSRHGNRRCVSVNKTKKKVDSTKRGEDLTSLTFSEGTNEVLRAVFTRYPPGDEEVIEKKDEKHSEKTQKQVTKDHFFCKPSMGKSEIERRVEEHTSKLENVTHLKQITRERSKLPIASFRDVITSTVESHQVVLISGETGCGKTTQSWYKGATIPFGSTCGIRVCLAKLCVLNLVPLSATSVAERISHERGEIIGNNVGYKDEIHERDRFSDFMLAVLRDMLPLCPHLRLVLRCLGGCPIIRVPGFTYPVKTYYLEDILSFLKSEKQNQLDCISGSASIENLEIADEEYRELHWMKLLIWLCQMMSLIPFWIYYLLKEPQKQ